MADPFLLTQKPITVSSAPTLQPIYTSMDVSAWDILDLELAITQIESGGSLDVSLVTAMQLDDDDGFTTVASFPTASPSTRLVKVSVPSGLLAYLRWKVTAIGGGNPVTFYIRGMGRAFR